MRKLLFDGALAVYDNGVVCRVVNGVETELAQRCKGGYKYVKIKTKEYLTHRLIATAFIDNPNNKPEVNHIDGNKDNNNVSNLEWVTHSENVKHAWDTGLRNRLQDKENNNGGINLFADARRAAGLTQKQAAQELRVRQSTIANWETGCRKPAYTFITAMAKLYGCTTDYLLGVD